MNRRRLLQLLAAGAASAVAGPPGPLASAKQPRTEEGIEIARRAVELVQDHLVVDLLGLLTLDWPKLFRWQSAPESFGLDDVRKLSSSGIDVFHPAVAPSEVDQYAAATRWLDGWNRLIENHPCHLLRVDDVTDLLVLPRLGQVGVVLGFQNSEHFRTPEDVESFHRRGQRISQLTYNARNRLGSGCKELTDRGLTTFGSEVIAAMNEVGMVVDLSHCGPRTTAEAIEASNSPVMISHSNCRTLVPWQRRNKTDTEIREMARHGGVMGITTVTAFVGGGGPGRGPSLDDWLDHFDHVARLVGTNYVALGSDIDVDAVDSHGRPIPYYLIRGLRPGARAFQLADGLLRRGWSEKQVQDVLGGNVLRVLASIWDQQIEGRPLRRDPFCQVLPDETPSGVEIRS